MEIKLYDSLGHFVGTRDEQSIENPHSQMTKDFFYFGGRMYINDKLIKSPGDLAKELDL